ncbi:MAG TPA: hypothetical protein VMI34_07425 [Candidatus Bathyarchaeia archaeon]|nr:hypothetical protein [Candidatus Bathyarchaeia archaeon]
MKFRAALALALLGCLAFLAPLAYANPPDPTWTSGVYDDADLDAIVGLITSESGLAEPFGAPDLSPTTECVTSVVGNDEAPVLAPPHPGDAIRAPPSA